MLILSIFGSPRKNSFSSAIHNEFLVPFEKYGVEIIRKYAYSLDINPCMACEKCKDDKSCIYVDDMLDIYQLIERADIIVISCPLYFSSFPAPLKAIMDRCQIFWENVPREKHQIKKKSGFFISTGGSEYKNMFSGVILSMRHFYSIFDIVLTEENTLLYSNTDQWDKISVDILNNCRNIGVKYLNGILKNDFWGVSNR